MANQEHLAVLKRGVNLWNQWREDSPEKRPDLSGAYLGGADLEDTNLSKADLSGTYLRRANLVRADLHEAYLRRVDLFAAHLKSADLREANLSKANLSKANLSEAHINSADLREADLSESSLSGTNLRSAIINKADLSGANLSRANLSGANLSDVNLRQANLSDSNLSEANLSGADLREADLSRTLIGRTALINVDLSHVNGLDQVEYSSPSPIGMDTIYNSAGEIPEEFLRGCGLSDMQIAMVKLHRRGLRNEDVTDLVYDIHQLIVLGAIHSHSSFISYSMNDQEFADKLYDDLQRSGVRCWFAVEDMPIGAKILDEIDRAISRQENVILILSKNALNSGWVEDEVLRAFEVELERGRRILLPIRLDDSVMKSNKTWVKKVRRRLVGDFRDWQDDWTYNLEFNRLLRGLKATAEGGE